MTEDEKAELADVYEKAAEYLEEYGWCKGTFGSRGTPRCFAGGVMQGAEYDNDLYEKALKFALRALELNFSDENVIYPIGVWNDQDDRTADEVINTLHALANKLR